MTEKNLKEGKNLSTILVPTSGNYPVRGTDGYSGEQDGSSVEYLGVYQFPSRKVAKEIIIGKRVGIQWATYVRGTGWQVSLAYWDDADEKDVWIQCLTEEIRKQVQCI